MELTTPKHWKVGDEIQIAFHKATILEILKVTSDYQVVRTDQPVAIPDAFKDYKGNTLPIAPLKIRGEIIPGTGWNPNE